MLKVFSAQHHPLDLPATPRDCFWALGTNECCDAFQLDGHLYDSHFTLWWALGRHHQAFQLGQRWLPFSRSVVSNSLRPHGRLHTGPPCPSPTPSLLKLMSIELVMPSNHLLLCHPHLLLPSVFPNIRIFSNESVLLIKQPK